MTFLGSCLFIRVELPRARACVPIPSCAQALQQVFEKVMKG